MVYNLYQVYADRCNLCHSFLCMKSSQEVWNFVKETKQRVVDDINLSIRRIVYMSSEPFNLNVNSDFDGPLGTWKYSRLELKYVSIPKSCRNCFKIDWDIRVIIVLLGIVREMKELCSGLVLRFAGVFEVSSPVSLFC